MIDCVRRLRAHDRLRAVSNRNIGLRQHRQIIRAVADRDREPVVAAILLRKVREARRLRIGVDNVADDAPGQAAIGDAEDVRQRVNRSRVAIAADR